ncbi:MAG: hypothetical protein KDE35_17675 [Geminicoccaceae bacterium]|nr:hypothetical protein [Geminicoccaceae bacterium]
MAGGMRVVESADETYYVSLNDMMIGLLFLFIIILMAFALNFRTAEREAGDMLDRLGRERDGLAAERDLLAEERDLLADERDRLALRRDELERVTMRLLDRDRLRHELLLEIRRRLAARGIDVVVEPEKGILRLPESLLFASARAELIDAGRQALAVLAEVLQATVPCYARAPRAAARTCPPGASAILETVLIEGHTDDVPLSGGPHRDNWQLSAARGVATFKTLMEMMPSLDELDNARGEKLFGVAGYERRRPVAIGADADARRQNRRIDLRFVVAAPDADELAAPRHDRDADALAPKADLPNAADGSTGVPADAHPPDAR